MIVSSTYLIAFTTAVLVSTITSADAATVTGLPTALQKAEGDCRVDRDCQANAYCHDRRKCLCNNRFIAINNSTTGTFICVNEASLVGDMCHYDVQCTAALGPHSECSGSNEKMRISGKCQCKQDYHYRDGICYRNSRIGESCQVNDNCVVSSANIVAYCDERRCICPPFYHANVDGTDCLPSSELSGPCKSDEDCITANSRCLGVCQCHIGYVMNKRKTHCLIAADRLNAACDEDVQCSTFIKRSICDQTTNRCNCSIGSHQVNGACYKTAQLTEPCSRKEECSIKSADLTRVQCYNNFCLCADNHENVNKSDCVPVQQRSLAGNNSWPPLRSSLPLALITLIFSLVV